MSPSAITAGRAPRTGPSRRGRAVAPSSTAASKSPDIPIDSSGKGNPVRSRSRSRSSRSRTKDGRACSGVVPYPAMVISPTIGTVRHEAMASASLSIPSGDQPCFDASPEQFAWRQTAGGSGRLVDQQPEQLQRIDPVDQTSPAGRSASSCSICRWPIRCQRIAGRSANASTFLQSSCGKFSPRSNCPASISGRIRSGGCVLVTATSVTEPGSRPDSACRVGDPITDRLQIGPDVLPNVGHAPQCTDAPVARQERGDGRPIAIVPAPSNAQPQGTTAHLACNTPSRLPQFEGGTRNSPWESPKNTFDLTRFTEIKKNHGKVFNGETGGPPMAIGTALAFSSWRLRTTAKSKGLTRSTHIERNHPPPRRRPISANRQRASGLPRTTPPLALSYNRQAPSGTEGVASARLVGVSLRRLWERWSAEWNPGQLFYCAVPRCGETARTVAGRPTHSSPESRWRLDWK